MKRIVSGIIAVLLLATLGGVAHAEEESVEAAIGLKAWMNSGKREMPGADSVTSNSIFLVGPTFEAVEGNYFLEASYLMSLSDYKFSEGGVDTKYSRKDWDAAFGYFLAHDIGLFVGYRSSELKEKETSAEETSSGWLAGIKAAIPVADALAVTGKASYLFTKLKTDAGSEQAPGWVAELGLRYTFSEDFTGTLGYQYETTKTKDTSIKDTFSGATLGVMYAF